MESVAKSMKSIPGFSAGSYCSSILLLLSSRGNEFADTFGSIGKRSSKFVGPIDSGSLFRRGLGREGSMARDQRCVQRRGD